MYEHLSGTFGAKRPGRAGFHEQLFDTGNVRINYVSGPDNGPPLVLVPAQTGTWESYLRVLVPLSKDFHVHAIDVRGHGKSSWTPGKYSWRSIGEDLRAFLRDAVRRPAIVGGNSSGGLIALWCGANLPELTTGIIIEDAPVFSAELPRFRDRDKYVYNGLRHLVEALGDLEHRDLTDYLRGQTLPLSETREKSVPEWFLDWLSRRIKAYQARHPGEPVDIGYFPTTLRLLLKSLSMFDPDFARAFVDGRFYDGLDHAEALKRVECPMLVLHANWRRLSKHGLVGAMDDEDAARIQVLAPHSTYVQVPANHVIHMFKPKRYVAEVRAFYRSMA